MGGARAEPSVGATASPLRTNWRAGRRPAAALSESSADRAVACSTRRRRLP